VCYERVKSECMIEEYKARMLESKMVEVFILIAMAFMHIMAFGCCSAINVG